MPKHKQLIIHPFLFAIYPVLFLYIRNRQEVSFVHTLIPAAAVLTLALILQLGLRWSMRDGPKAALMASLIIVMLLSYGHAEQYGAYFHVREPFPPFASAQTENLLFACVWVAIGLLAALFILRTQMSLRGLTRFLNAAASFLIVLSVLGIAGGAGPGEARAAVASRWERLVTQECKEERILPERAKKPLPDIYYIILDEYTSREVLTKYYGFDNNDFIRFLRRRGFYVEDDSRSNYTSTNLSLPSSLNFDYIQSLSERLNGSPLDRQLFVSAIRDSKIARLLKNAGYTFVVCPSIFYMTEHNPLADVILGPERRNLTEFDQVLIGNSMLKLAKAGAGPYRRRISRAFDQIADVVRMKAPTFTFAHITIPHPPFVFDENGRMPWRLRANPYLDEETYRARYVGQCKHTSKRLVEMVDRILDESENPPIIILQGDHGPYYRPSGYADEPEDSNYPEDMRGAGKYVRAGVLNAYCLPDGGVKHLYPGITPVNSFRVVLNHYFGANYELLPDVTYIAEANPVSIRADQLVVLPK